MVEYGLFAVPPVDCPAVFKHITLSLGGKYYLFFPIRISFR